MKSSPRTGDLLDRGLRMFVQPVVDLTSGDVVRVEGLARLELDDGTIVPPGFFVPDLYPSELDALFRFGLDGLLGAAAQWDERGIEIAVGLNLPPSTLRNPEVTAWVERALQTHGVGAHRLVLELLEDQAVETDAQCAVFDALRGLGVKVVMDDLGRGFSDVCRLDALAFDGVKIDRHLVQGLLISPVDTLPVVAPLIEASLRQHCVVVAEGLEDWSLVEALRALGASRGQGHAIAPPMPTDAFATWWQAWDPPRDRLARIETTLGAVCSHWSSHVAGRSHEGPATDCPVGAACAAAPPTVQSAHDRLHAEAPDRVSSAEVLEWLIHSFASADPAGVGR